MTSRFNPARLLMALSAAILSIVSASQAVAQAAYGPRIARLFVVDRDSGVEKPVYYHNRRYWIAGDEGRRYALRIQNVSSGRAMIMLSVDGVNVISGNTASYDDRGYILEAGQSADIKGWRKNQEELAVFRFAPLPQSYAARTGRPIDVGVIGMAVFQEAVRPPPPAVSPPVTPRPAPEPRVVPKSVPRNSTGSRYDSAPSPAPPPPPPSVVMAPPPPPPLVTEPAPPPPPGDNRGGLAMQRRSNERLGTAHGEIEREYMPIVPFEKATRIPASVRVIEYDSRDNLIAAGVIPRGRNPQPRPFPGERGSEGYVPDPPG
jgi:hypothetical protein